MQIRSIGILTPDPDIEEWVQSEEVSIPYFQGKKLQFILENYEKDSKPQDFETAINNFLALNLENRNQASEAVYKHYKEIADSPQADNLDVTISTPEEVWDCIHPTEIYVSRRSVGEKKVYLQIACECIWELEHGLQIIYQQGETLTRVSSQDGHLTNEDVVASDFLGDLDSLF